MIQNDTEIEEFCISAVSIESLPSSAVSRIIGGAPTVIQNFPYAVQVCNFFFTFLTAVYNIFSSFIGEFYQVI